MGIVPGLVLAALLLSGLGVVLFFWAVGDGQFDDLETHAAMPLHDGDDRPARPDGPIGSAR
jgi:cbb3-type cytochrome oxidase maturation protein